MIQLVEGAGESNNESGSGGGEISEDDKNTILEYAWNLQRAFLPMGQKSHSEENEPLNVHSSRSLVCQRLVIIPIHVSFQCCCWTINWNVEIKIGLDSKKELVKWFEDLVFFQVTIKEKINSHPAGQSDKWPKKKSGGKFSQLLVPMSKMSKTLVCTKLEDPTWNQFKKLMAEEVKEKRKMKFCCLGKVK